METKLSINTERESVIRARSLTKKYKDFVAVDGIDFDVYRGESFGLLGPNGAGKSTTMKMITSVSQRTSGELTILGKEPNSQGPEIRAHLGVVPQKDMLDRELKVWENLVTYGRYFGLPRKWLKTKVEELLEFAQLTDKRNEKADDLSGGMQRRLAIARGLVNEPEILLLDEPTTGLDPQARHILWDRLFRLKEQGVTLVLTTHYMDEAEQLCDRLVVMDQAKIVAEGSPRQLIEQHASREVLELRFPDGTSGISKAALEGIGDRYERLAERVIVGCENGEEAHARALAHGLTPESWLVRRSSLEDVFLRLTGRSLDE